MGVLQVLQCRTQQPGNPMILWCGLRAIPLWLLPGMMSETPPTARFAIIGHVVHLVNRDYDAMAKDYYGERNQLL